MLNNIKIGTRLGLGFGVLLVSLCAVAGIGTYQTSMINDNVVDLAVNRLPSVKVLGELRALANGVRRATLRHLLEVEKAGKDAQASAHDELANTKLPASLAAYQKFVSSPEETRLYERIKSGWNAYLEHDKQLIALSNNGPSAFAEARELSTGPSAASFNAVMKTIEEDVELNAAYASASGDAAALSYHRVLWINMISVGLAVLCGIGLGIVTTRSITRPIQQAVKLAGVVAEGDLTSRIDIQGKDETAQLLHSLSRMNDSLNASSVGFATAATVSRPARHRSPRAIRT